MRTYTTGLAFNSIMFLACISSWRILRICENPKLKTFVCKKTTGKKSQCLSTGLLLHFSVALI